MASHKTTPMGGPAQPSAKLPILPRPRARLGAKSILKI
jgi:hypothetical protein